MVVGFFNSYLNYVILLDVDGYNEKKLGILFVHAYDSDVRCYVALVCLCVCVHL